MFGIIGMCEDEAVLIVGDYELPLDEIIIVTLAGEHIGIWRGDMTVPALLVHIVPSAHILAFNTTHLVYDCPLNARCISLMNS